MNPMFFEMSRNLKPRKQERFAPTASRDLSEIATPSLFMGKFAYIRLNTPMDRSCLPIPQVVRLTGFGPFFVSSPRRCAASTRLEAQTIGSKPAFADSFRNVKTRPCPPRATFPVNLVKSGRDATEGATRGQTQNVKISAKWPCGVRARERGCVWACQRVDEGVSSLAGESIWGEDMKILIFCV